MDQFLTFLEQKRGKLRRKLERLQRELSEIDKSERLYRASAAAPKGKKAKGVAALSNLAPSGGQPLPAPSIGTIKERVLQLLAKNPDGLTSAQILNVLHISGLPNLARESLSPQLSRLKKEREIGSEHGLYKLQKHETQGG